MKSVRYVLTGLIIAGLLAAGVLLAKKYQPVKRVAESSEKIKAKGPLDALIQIVEYSDFQCPACARAEAPLLKVLNDPLFAGKIRFVYRHFPLTGHQWSGLAHQAAECANEQGKFWEYHDKLYGDQAVWSGLENPMDQFVRYARELNLQVEGFGVCLANPEIHRRITAEKKMGEALQIRSTPTFFINGERLVGPVDFEKQAQGLIRKALGLPALAESAAAAAAQTASAAVQSVGAAVNSAAAAAAQAVPQASSIPAVSSLAASKPASSSAPVSAPIAAVKSESRPS